MLDFVFVVRLFNTMQTIPIEANDFHCRLFGKVFRKKNNKNLKFFHKLPNYDEVTEWSILTIIGLVFLFRIKFDDSF